MGLIERMRRVFSSRTAASHVDDKSYLNCDLAFQMSRLLHYLEEAPEAFPNHSVGVNQWWRPTPGSEMRYALKTPDECARFHSAMHDFYPELRIILAHSVAHLPEDHRSPRMKALLADVLANTPDDRLGMLGMSPRGPYERA